MYKKYYEESSKMNKEVMKGALQMMHTTNKENTRLTNFLSKKLNDQKDQLICKEVSRRNMIIRKLNMIRQNIKKAQEKASGQAKILHENNLQRIGCKSQIKTQKMYFDLFKVKTKKEKPKNNKSFASGRQNLLNFIQSQLKSSRAFIQTDRKKMDSTEIGQQKSMNTTQLPRLNFQQTKSFSNKIRGTKRETNLLSQRTLFLPTLHSRLFGQSSREMAKNKKEATMFVKSHVNSSSLIPYSVSYENEKRGCIKFLRFLKSLPYVCHYYLSQIQVTELPVNVVSLGTKKLYDLRKVHEMLNSLDEKNQGTTSRGLCEMYDDNLNLISS